MMTILLTSWYQSLNPLKQAKLKLAGWYMLVSLVIVVAFSLLMMNAREVAFVRVYRVIDEQTGRKEEVETFARTFEEFNNRFNQRLLLFDIVLVLISAGVSYWLAGVTLKPIENMMSEQALFAADLSHELRTPLTSMKLLLEQVRRAKLQSQQNDRLQLLSKLDAQVSSMSNIIAGLLLLVRVDNPLVHVEEEVFDARDVLKDAISQIEPHVSRSNSFLKLDIVADTPLMVKGYREQIRQVIGILLDNAMKYSPPNSTIIITQDSDQSSALFAVRNPGEGLTTDQQKRVFERFFRGKESKKKGTGLGLAIAKRIVEFHKGRIWVKSELGAFTEFRVRLPLVV